MTAPLKPESYVSYEGRKCWHYGRHPGDSQNLISDYGKARAVFASELSPWIEPRSFESERSHIADHVRKEYDTVCADWIMALEPADPLPALRQKILANPHRIEYLGGQQTKYIQLDDVIALIDEASRIRALSKPDATALSPSIEEIASKLLNLSFAGTEVWKLAHELRSVKDYRSEWERECDDTDALMQSFELEPEQYRTEGGSLNVRRAHELLGVFRPGESKVTYESPTGSTLEIPIEEAGAQITNLSRVNLELIQQASVRVKHMVDRFLQWQLPDSFAPGGGISYRGLGFGMPTGTNLFFAHEAEVMVRYMVEGIELAKPDPAPAASVGQSVKPTRVDDQEIEDSLQDAVSDGEGSLHARKLKIVRAGDSMRVIQFGYRYRKKDWPTWRFCNVKGDDSVEFECEPLYLSPPPSVKVEDLDFDPKGENLADLANIGHRLLDVIASNHPGWAWSESPTEILAYLANQLADSTAAAEEVRKELLELAEWWVHPTPAGHCIDLVAKLRRIAAKLGAGK